MGDKIVCRGCGGRTGNGCEIVKPRWSDDLTGFYCPREDKFMTLAEIAAINERTARSPVGLIKDEPYIMHDSRQEGNEDRTEGTGRRGARSEESFKSFPKDSRTPTTPPQISQTTNRLGEPGHDGGD